MLPDPSGNAHEGIESGLALALAIARDLSPTNSHKASQKLPICYYDSKLCDASIEHAGNAENQPERRKHEEKQ